MILDKATMKTASRIKIVQRILKEIRREKRIAFVPTMGVFHEGHLSLMRKAKKECDFLVVSLFVNPLQFGPNEDFKIYPRDISADKKLAEEAGVNLLWIPFHKELFRPRFQTTIEVAKISQRWEGESRPGHFKGVATIVAKLLQVVRPNRLYLGQKDYQQTRVIQQMMEDLHFDTEVRILPTIREANGLAMSSRNQRLSSAKRKAGAVLYRALRQAETRVRKGERLADVILSEAATLIKNEPHVEIDYLALCDPETLKPIETLERHAICLAAIKIGSVRLIDNIFLSA